MKEIHDGDFDALTADGIALLDFGAAWCGPCQSMLPMLERLEEELSTRVSFYSVDIDQDPSLAARQGVMSVPTILLFRDGKPVDRIVGLATGRELRERIGRHLEA